MSMMGSTLPVARTAAQRTGGGDPRPSIEERYRGRQDYCTRVRHAAEEMISLRHLLPEDLDGVVERAGRLWDFVQAAPRA